MKELEGFVVDPLYIFGTGRQCFWCGRFVRYAEEGAKQPDKGLATRDHLIPKMQRKFLKLQSDGIIVLSCYQCNNERGADMKWRPKDRTDNAVEFFRRVQSVGFCIPANKLPKPRQPKSRRKQRIKLGQMAGFGLTNSR